MAKFGDNWDYEQGGNYFKVFPKDGYFTTTGIGNDDTIQLIIPFWHRFNRFYYTHLDSSDNLIRTELQIKMRRKKGSISGVSRMQDILWQETDITATDGEERFPEPSEYEPSLWEVILNAANTNRVVLVFYIQKIAQKVK